MFKHNGSDQGSRRHHGANGFTLIELLVVIVILGILAAVVVFAVSGIQDRGQESACDTDERTLRTAIEAFQAQTDDYPASGDQAALVSAGFLSQESTTHDFTISGNSIGITDLGECATP